MVLIGSMEEKVALSDQIASGPSLRLFPTGGAPLDTAITDYEALTYGELKDKIIHNPNPST